MLIGGIQKTTLLDYPGKVATLLFTVGCNLRCQFCYNPQFVIPQKIKKIAGDFIHHEAVLAFLAERGDLLDGVVICGGEPTLQEGLDAFIKDIKKMGLLVKLDTNGCNPKLLERLLKEKLLDYVAMDIKDNRSGRPALTGGLPDEIENYKQSIALLQTSGVEHEFRTTVIKNYHTTEKIIAIAQTIGGNSLYALQNFTHDTELLNPYFKGRSFSELELKALRRAAAPFVAECVIRG